MDENSISINNRALGKKKKKEKKERIWEIDFIRSIPIILVMLYHLCYYFFDIPPGIFSNYYDLETKYPAYMSFIDFCRDDIFYNPLILKFFEPFFAGVFLFVCGISCSLSRSNLRRGILLGSFAVILSVGTYFASEFTGINMFIVFGVIHVMAFSILVYYLLELFFKLVFKKQVPAILSLAIGIGVLVFGIIAKNFLGWQSTLPYRSYLKNIHNIALGINAGGADYFPIFPNLGTIFCGIAVGKVLYGKNKKSLVPSLYCKAFSPLCFMGRHTLWFYFLSTPIFIGLIIGAMLIMGYKIDFEALL